MKVYISVVSHSHSALISQLNCLEKLSDLFQVVVKSNTADDEFTLLDKENNFHWLNEEYSKGFGENNNIVYKHCKSKLNMLDEDYFIVLNPDVDIEVDAIFELITCMEKDKEKFSTINLFKDKNKTIYDPSIRKFPTLRQFVFSLIGLGNSSIIDKSTIVNPKYVDWAAGSFLAFKAGHYGFLKGFDERYFMYCEDIDICYRSNCSGTKLTYYPNIKAMHLAKHENRKILSKHFYWHISSAIRFLLTKGNSKLTKNYR